MARVGAVVWGFVSSVPPLLKPLLKLRYPRAQQGKGWWRETLLCFLLVLEILLALPQAPGGGKGGLFLFLRLALIPAEDLISCSSSSSALLQCLNSLACYCFFSPSCKLRCLPLKVRFVLHNCSAYQTSSAVGEKCDHCHTQRAVQDNLRWGRSNTPHSWAQGQERAEESGWRLLLPMGLCPAHTLYLLSLL